MNRGKNICNELKAVRRSIAEENNIPLEIPDCPHQGPCPGTCPRCEMELRQLEAALADRLRLGKVATVAGLALGLAVGTAQAQAPVVKDTVRPALHTGTFNNAVTVRGTILDEKTKEPLPFVHVCFKQEGTLMIAGVTDFDGKFRVDIPVGQYDVDIACIGYSRKIVKVNITSANRDIGEIMLTMSATVLGLMPVIEVNPPLIEVDPYGSNQHMEIEGVKVNVR